MTVVKSQLMARREHVARRMICKQSATYRKHPRRFRCQHALICLLQGLPFAGQALLATAFQVALAFSSAALHAASSPFAKAALASSTAIE